MLSSVHWTAKDERTEREFPTNHKGEKVHNPENVNQDGNL